MKKKKGSSYVVILLVLSIAVIGATFVVMHNMLGEKMPESSVIEAPVKEEEKITEITLKDYQVYAKEQVDFKYIIARFLVNTNTEVDLSHFVTNEGITLDQSESYLVEMKNKGVKVESDQIVTTLQASGSPYEAEVFIPVTIRGERTLTVTCDLLEDQKFSFNVANVEKKEEEKEEEYESQADEVISDDETYQIVVQNAFEITGETLYAYDMEYGLPSTARVFVFHVKASSLNGEELAITEATYNTGTYGTFEAEEGAVHCEKYANVMGKTISEDSSGYLYFVTLDPDNEILGCSGKLSISLAGVDEPVEVNVEL